MAQDYDLLRIKVRIGDKEAEISYPLTARTVVGYSKNEGTLTSAVEAVKDIVKVLSQGE
jgi:hypothetical protein